MEKAGVKLVTIVTEALLEPRIIEEITQLGARGYTITEVKGFGSRGVRDSDLDGKNVKVEAIVSHRVADAILEVVHDKFFRSYAMVAWLTDVEVVRAAKYVSP